MEIFKDNEIDNILIDRYINNRNIYYNMKDENGLIRSFWDIRNEGKQIFGNPDKEDKQIFENIDNEDKQISRNIDNVGGQIFGNTQKRIFNLIYKNNFQNILKIDISDALSE